MGVLNLVEFSFLILRAVRLLVIAGDLTLSKLAAATASRDMASMYGLALTIIQSSPRIDQNYSRDTVTVQVGPIGCLDVSSLHPPVLMSLGF